MTLTGTDPLTLFIINQGITTWQDLITVIQNLQYGRISNKSDLSLVLKERKGTCSTKHALLKKVAGLNKLRGITLQVGIYKMTEGNTPGIGNELSTHGLSYIPEAHCYLKIDGQARDFTSVDSKFEVIKSVIVDEIEISPEQIGDFKFKYHRAFLANWIIDENIGINLEDIWVIRERCISNIAAGR